METDVGDRDEEEQVPVTLRKSGWPTRSHWQQAIVPEETKAKRRWRNIEDQYFFACLKTLSGVFRFISKDKSP